MGIRFITDSGSDIPQENGCIEVLPLNVSFGEDNFKDGVDLSHREFYDKLSSIKELPITGQVTPYQFSEAYKKAVEEGDVVIVITISSKLSGTYQSAVLAAADYPGKVYVIDSLNATVGQRALAEYGVQLEKQGLQAEEIVEILNKEKRDIHLIGRLDTLEYLKRGGRISATAAIAGSLFSVKPVVAIRDGEVVLVGKARGSKQANNLLAKEIEESGDIDFSRAYFLGYTGNSTELLTNYINDFEYLWKDRAENLPIMSIGGAIGTHIGPGAIAVAFFARSKEK